MEEKYDVYCFIRTIKLTKQPLRLIPLNTSNNSTFETSKPSNQPHDVSNVREITLVKHFQRSNLFNEMPRTMPTSRLEISPLQQSYLSVIGLTIKGIVSKALLLTKSSDRELCFRNTGRLILVLPTEDSKLTYALVLV